MSALVRACRRPSISSLMRCASENSASSSPSTSSNSTSCRACRSLPATTAPLSSETSILARSQVRRRVSRLTSTSNTGCRSADVSLRKLGGSVGSITSDGSGTGSGTSVSHSQRETASDGRFSTFTVCTIVWPSLRVRKLMLLSRNCRSSVSKYLLCRSLLRTGSSSRHQRERRIRSNLSGSVRRFTSISWFSSMSLVSELRALRLDERQPRPSGAARDESVRARLAAPRAGAFVRPSL